MNKSSGSVLFLAVCSLLAAVASARDSDIVTPLYKLSYTFEEACAKAHEGDARGCFEAAIYFTGNKGVSHDYHKADSFFDRAYEKNYPWAILLRGFAFIDDDPKNYYYDEENKFAYCDLVDGAFYRRGFMDRCPFVCWSADAMSDSRVIGMEKPDQSIKQDKSYERAIAEFEKFLTVNTNQVADSFVRRQIGHIQFLRATVARDHCRATLRSELIVATEAVDTNRIAELNVALERLEKADSNAVVSVARELQQSAREAAKERKQNSEKQKEERKAAARRELEKFKEWPSKGYISERVDTQALAETEEKFAITIIDEFDDRAWTNTCGKAVIRKYWGRNRDHVWMTFVHKYNADGALTYAGPEWKLEEMKWFYNRKKELCAQYEASVDEMRVKVAARLGMTVEEAEERYEDLSATAGGYTRSRIRSF